MDNESKPDDDDRPPICPACGVTMGIILAEDGATRYACLECGFSDETTPFVSEDRPRGLKRGLRAQKARSRSHEEC